MYSSSLTDASLCFEDNIVLCKYKIETPLIQIKECNSLRNGQCMAIMQTYFKFLFFIEV